MNDRPSYEDWVLAHIPTGGTVYCEPFGGSARILLRKDPHPVEVWNDADPALYDAMRNLRANIRQPMVDLAARDLGPRIAHAILPIPGKGDSDWGYAWIPVLAPILGGIAGAMAYKALGVMDSWTL